LSVADESLGVLNNSFWTGDRIANGFCSNHRLVAIKKDGRWSRQFPFLIGYGDRLAMFIQPGNAGVRCTEVNADCMSVFHIRSLISSPGGLHRPDLPLRSGAEGLTGVLMVLLTFKVHYRKSALPTGSVSGIADL
jgi:hypothetical protein